MYRIGAIRVGQMSAWQSLQNNRYQSANFASDAAMFSTMSDSLFGAQQTKLSGIANLVVQAALTRLQSTQTAHSNSALQQAGSTLNQSTSSTSPTGSVLNMLA
ncbi:MAG: hypothetical protein ABSF41_02560 [Pseudolabrys sp.]